MAITVRRRLDRDEATGQRRWAEDTFTYGGYATADLSYGATAHTKQGKTVTAAMPLVTGTESAEWLYSAMTRGKQANIACVFTHPTGDPAEQSPRARPGQAPRRQQHCQAVTQDRSPGRCPPGCEAAAWVFAGTEGPLVPVRCFRRVSSV